jgi:hypothetical protein
VIAGATPIGRPNLTQVTPARAVTPAPVSPPPDERPAPPLATAIAASFVALAPAAMSALIEAQAQASGDTSELARQHTQRKIEQLIVRLDGDPPPPPADGTPFTLVRLQAARAALG